ncbi:MAG: hypothetical protein CSA95_05935 [Bacteroidetes bacterium]|nr:MAG: hypothetical protein CSA95_05935 [Bacteroidota bacterium]
MIPSVYLFFNLSGSELLVIVAVIFLLFGPSGIREIGKKTGSILQKMKKATQDFTQELTAETDQIAEEINNLEKDIKQAVGKDQTGNTKN